MLIKANIIALVLVSIFALVFLVLVNTPCASEDSTNCVWDASVQGNGKGHSFIDVNGTAFYLGK